MAKTCRACNESVMEPRCYYHAKRFCYRAEDCPHYGQRETPLLVDVLADVLAGLLSAREMAAQTLLDEGYAALARHKEEAGDGEG